MYYTNRYNDYDPHADACDDAGDAYEAAFVSFGEDWQELSTDPEDRRLILSPGFSEDD